MKLRNRGMSLLMSAASLMPALTATAAGTSLPIGKPPATLAWSHAFSGPPDGLQPIGGLVRGADGALYGTTQYGGEFSPDPLAQTYGNGTVFRFTDTGDYAVLHSFAKLADDYSNTDGRWPITALTAAPGGELYGVTQAGGSADAGVLFRIAADGAFEVWHHFGVSGTGDGSFPNVPPALLPDGSLLGTTRSGGGLYALASQGAAYSIQVASGTAPAISASRLATTDGALYGNAYMGGVLRYKPGDTAYALIHDQDYASEGGSRVITNIPGLTAAPDGYLYGAASDGGANDSGTVFRVRADGSGFRVLHVFSAVNRYGRNADGAHPHTTPVLGPDGLLYGAALSGGRHGGGVAYRMAADGSNYTVLYAFSQGNALFRPAAGIHPGGDVAFSPAGRLCGSSYHGSRHGYGAIWCLDVSH